MKVQTIPRSGKRFIHPFLTAECAVVFQRSLTSLELTEVAPVTPVIAEEAPYPVIVKKEDPKPVTGESSMASSSLETSVFRQGQRREPARDIINVLEKFSMVTKFARDTTAHLFGESRILGNSEMDFDRAPTRLLFMS